MGRGLGVDKPCVKCGRDVPYAYKSPIPGFCGRCTDEVLRTLQAGQGGPSEGRSGRLAALAAGGTGKGFAIGAIVTLLLLLAIAVFANGPFTSLVDGIRGALGLG